MTWLSWVVTAGTQVIQRILFMRSTGAAENETTDNEDGLPLNELLSIRY